MSGNRLRSWGCWPGPPTVSGSTARWRCPPCTRPSALISRPDRAPEVDRDMDLSPAHIIQLGVGFWGPKTLLSAIELGVFTELAPGALAAEPLREHLRLHPGARDFFDALVALGMLERKDGLYQYTRNGPFPRPGEAHLYRGLSRDDQRPPIWLLGTLTEALRSGEPQNEIKTGGELFSVLYQDPIRLKQFLQAMTGYSMGTARPSHKSSPGSSIGRSSTSDVPRDASPSKSPWRIRTCPEADSTSRSWGRSLRSTLPI